MFRRRGHLPSDDPTHTHVVSWVSPHHTILLTWLSMQTSITGLQAAYSQASSWVPTSDTRRIIRMNWRRRLYRSLRLKKMTRWRHLCPATHALLAQSRKRSTCSPLPRHLGAPAKRKLCVACYQAQRGVRLRWALSPSRVGGLSAGGRRAQGAWQKRRGSRRG